MRGFFYCAWTAYVADESLISPLLERQSGCGSTGSQGEEVDDVLHVEKDVAVLFEVCL